MNILFAGGGSIGHIAPYVGVWRAVHEIEPSAQSLTICSLRPEESAFLKKEEMPTVTIPLPRRSLSFPFTFWKGYRIACNAMDSFRPDVIFCKGGSISIPVVLAARRKKIPVVIHESDAIAGRATRIAARFTKVVCTGFPHAAGLRGIRTVHTGNPVRPEISQGKREEGLRITGLKGDRPILLVCGGSQGSQTLNECIITHERNLLSLCDVIHLTGKGKKGAQAQEGYWSAPFAQEELPHLYASCDLALSRSGAGAIAELAENGIPTILVPLRGLAQDHQEKNAQEASKGGGCVLLEQEDLSSSLLPLIHQLLQERTTLETMSRKFHALFLPNAAKRIAKIVMQVAADATSLEIVAP